MKNILLSGVEIYRQLLPYSDKMYLTIIEKEFTADTFFPEIDYEQWEIIEKERGKKMKKQSSLLLAYFTEEKS